MKEALYVPSVRGAVIGNWAVPLVLASAVLAQPTVPGGVVEILHPVDFQMLGLPTLTLTNALMVSPDKTVTTDFPFSVAPRMLSASVKDVCACDWRPAAVT